MASFIGIKIYKKIKSKFCNKFKNKFLDYSAYCTLKEQREKIIQEFNDRENAVKLKENIDDNIDLLYEKVEENSDFIQHLKDENTLLKEEKELYALFVKEFYICYRKSDNNCIEKLIKELNLDLYLDGINSKSIDTISKK